MRHMNPSTKMRGRARDAANETDAAPLCMDQIRDLALRRPGTPVLSLYVRTESTRSGQHGGHDNADRDEVEG